MSIMPHSDLAGAQPISGLTVIGWESRQSPRRQAAEGGESVYGVWSVDSSSSPVSFCGAQIR
jgi:hypothetical protein